MFKRSLRTDIIFALILLLTGIYLTGWKNITPLIVENFTTAFFPLLIIACFFLFIFYLIGKKRKPGFLFGFDFWLTLLVYPVWALIQQLIIVLWIYFPVLKLTNSPFLSIVAGSLFFASLHLPKTRFFLVVLPAEFLCLYVFSQTGNILAVALYHSLVATPYYFWVYGDDVLKRRFAGK